MVNLLRDTEKQNERQKWSKVNIILNVLWLLLFVFMMCILGMGGPNIIWFIDMPSFILIFGFLVLALGVGGQMKYFWLGIRAAFVRNTLNMEEMAQLKKAEYALGFGIRIILMTGLVTAMISFVSIMGNLDDLDVLGPNLAVATLTMLYGVAFSMVLLVFKARVHNLTVE